MQWFISQIDQVYKDGVLVPTTAHWRCSHTEQEYSGSVYSAASVEGILDLSLNSVLNHLWSNGINKDSTEAACKAQIEQAKIQASIIAIKEMETSVVPDPKFEGVAFNDVMCSATRDDQNGLIAVLVAYQLQKSTFPPTKFYFVNGNVLELTASNLMPFVGVWMPFRQSFFK